MDNDDHHRCLNCVFTFIEALGTLKVTLSVLSHCNSAACLFMPRKRKLSCHMLAYLRTRCISTCLSTMEKVHLKLLKFTSAVTKDPINVSIGLAPLKCA